MNLYQILGVSIDANAEEIRAAYRKIRSSAHPDKQGDASMFVKIQQAYEILSDEKRKAQYDATGNINTMPELVAETTLLQLICQIIDQLDPDTQDLLAIARQQINAQIAQHNNNLKGLEKGISKREKAIKRLTKKGGGNNFISAALENQIVSTRKQIAEIKITIEHTKEVLALLDDFSYDVDKSQSPSYFFPTSATMMFTR